MSIEAYLGLALVCCLLWAYVFGDDDDDNVNDDKTNRFHQNGVNNITIDKAGDAAVGCVIDANADVNLCNIEIIYASQTGTAADFSVKLKQYLHEAFPIAVVISIYDIKNIAVVGLFF